MKTKKQIVAIVGTYYNHMVAFKKAFVEGRGVELYNSFKGKEGQEAHDALADIVDTIQSHVKGAAVEAKIKTPAYRVGVRTLDVSETDARIKEVEVSFRNKLNAEVGFTRKFSFSAEDVNLVSSIYDSFITVLNELAYIEQTQEVIDEVNATLAQIKEEHPEITVDVSFGYCADADSVIVLDITDTAVKFAASLSGALEATGMGMFQSGDGFSDLCRSRDIDSYVQAMSAIQFAPQVIKANIAIVLKMLGMKINSRADKVLRKTYHKKAEFLGNQKAGIGYFTETGKDGEAIFSLIEKKDDAYEVKLSPFNVKTLEKVKVDVIKKAGLKK